MRRRLFSLVTAVAILVVAIGGILLTAQQGKAGDAQPRVKGDALVNQGKESVTAESAQEKPPKMYTQREWNRTSVGGPGKVVRSAAELVKVVPPLDAKMAPEAAEKEVVAAVASILGVKEIDWKSQMVVVLFGGELRTDVKVGIQKLSVNDGTLTFHGSVILPGVNKRFPKTTPLTLILLVDRFDGPVTFKIERIPLR